LEGSTKSIKTPASIAIRVNTNPEFKLSYKKSSSKADKYLDVTLYKTNYNQIHIYFKIIKNKTIKVYTLAKYP